MPARKHNEHGRNPYRCSLFAKEKSLGSIRKVLGNPNYRHKYCIQPQTRCPCAWGWVCAFRTCNSYVHSFKNSGIHFNSLGNFKGEKSNFIGKKFTRW